MTAREDLTDILFTQLDHAAEPYEIAGKVIAEGWRPPARRIETAEELDALPVDTVIRWADTVEQHIGSGWWITPGTDDHSHSEQIIDVAEGNEIVVLWEPEAGA
jgi:hypothetical protein